MSNNKSSAQTSLLDTLAAQQQGVPKATPSKQVSPSDEKPVRKSPGAFRTISEVADELGVQQHVLRFWESKFSQVKPLKRGGGRRYYRPEDVELLRRIHTLLYVDGYTIKGVQKLLSNAKGPMSAIERTKAKSETAAEMVADGKDTSAQQPRAKQEELSGLLKELRAARKLLDEHEGA